MVFFLEQKLLKLLETSVLITTKKITPSDNFLGWGHRKWKCPSKVWEGVFGWEPRLKLERAVEEAACLAEVLGSAAAGLLSFSVPVAGR